MTPSNRSCLSCVQNTSAQPLICKILILVYRHWCCKEDVDKPVNVQRTKIVQAYKEGYYMAQTGTTKCGTFGWSSCPLYTTKTQ